MKKILFIGNSYTYFHDMPTEIFAPLAREDGEPVLVSSVTRGGVQLLQFTDPDGDLGKNCRTPSGGSISIGSFCRSKA